MSKIYCNNEECWYNNHAQCKAKKVYIHDDECLACRYDKPIKAKRLDEISLLEDAEKVRRDKNAKRVADKIREDLLFRMKEALNRKGGEA